MKIAICVNHFHPCVGGAEKVAKTIADYLSQSHEIFIFTRKLSKNRNLQEFKYPVFEYRQGEIVNFEKKLNSLNVDVVFIYSDVFDFFRQIITKKSSYKIIAALCGANWLYSHRNFVNVIYQNAKNINSLICHSIYDRDYRLCENTRLIEKTIIIPNGVNIEEFNNNTLKKSDLDKENINKQWILNVSNFFPGKGQEHIFEIISKLPNTEEIVYIQICNDIDFEIGTLLENKWRLKAEKLKPKIKIKLIKNASREKVIAYFKQSNVFVFSSEKEVAPLVLLESMTASLPWVSTNIGNSEELKGGIKISTMKDSRFHSVFNNRIYNSFSDAIPKLWNNPLIGEEGRKQVEEKFDWKKILPQYKSLIESCV